ncbi:MAG: flagellar hook-basal body complex protein FliE [Spirochaetales bacterium]|nr:flagellar hook-basal body complex protein FliE [Spirochaetales bacterium]
MFLRSNEAVGHLISLKTTNPKHISGAGFQGESKPGVEKSFGDVLISAFNDVNDVQVKTTELNEQMITDPDSVNVHDVTIALAEANLALSITKGVVDRAIRAYKEIISIR